MAGKGKKAPKSGKSKAKAGKRTKKVNRTFARYIFKVVKNQNKNLGLTAKGMAVLNSFVNHMLGSIGAEAAALLRGRTIKASTAAAAVRFVVPGELGRRAAVEGAKAVTKFAASK
jgi:histone H2B